MNTNVIPDIPRLYTALAEWLSCMIIILTLKPRLNLKRFIPFSICYLAALIIFMELTATVVIWLWVPCMLAAFMAMTGFIYISAQKSYYMCVYYAVMAFSTAELVASLEWQIVNLLRTRLGDMHKVLEYAVLVLVYAALMFIVYRLLARKRSVISQLYVSHGEWLTAIFIAIIVFTFSNLRFLTEDIPVPGQFPREIANVRTLVDIAGVALLYAHYVSCCNNAVLRELEAVQNTLQTQYTQYKHSRESIDLINMRYHDLKHQIQFLRSERDEEKRNAFLDQMENEIKSFEVQNKTGNAVLDTILTGKALYCYKHGITMTTVADGKLLDFMDVVDICNIFGNALDNAIESVLCISDKEKRLIHVTVSQMGGFVMIRIENYFEGEIRLDGTDYLTTKSDDKLHGYGIKSIKYTADRYDGAVYISAKDNWFDIKIAIPIKN